MARQIGRNISIRAWNLSLAAERERYETEVALIVTADLLNGSQVGRIVVESIQAISRRRMTIQPYTAAGENAETVPLDERGATQRGASIRDGVGVVDHRAGIGTGVGTSTVVRFSPRRHVVDLSHMFAGARRAAVQYDRSEVLLHEMSHGLRQMLGVQTSLPMPDGLENDEEFFAALVTNIYSSEKNRPLLADHGVRVLSDPGVWLSGATYVAAVKRFRQHMPDFAARISRVGTRFNPFRDVTD